MWNNSTESVLHGHIIQLMKEKDALERQLRSKKYRRDKAEKLRRENLYLKDHIKHLELELSIWKKTDLFK